MQCDFMAEIIHFLWDMANDIELRKPSMSRAEDVFVCTFLRCGVSNRRSGLCIVECNLIYACDYKHSFNQDQGHSHRGKVPHPQRLDCRPFRRNINSARHWCVADKTQGKSSV